MKYLLILDEHQYENFEKVDGTLMRIDVFPHKLAEQILPLMEFRQEYNMEHDNFVTYGRIRVEEPEFKHQDFDTVKRFTDGII